MTFKFRGRRYRIRPDRMEKYKAAAGMIIAVAAFGALRSLASTDGPLG